MKLFYLCKVLRVITCLMIIGVFNANSNNRSEQKRSISITETRSSHRRLHGFFDLFFSSNDRNSCKLYEKLALNDTTIEVYMIFDVIDGLRYFINHLIMQRPLKVMVFVDSMYLNVFANWLAYYRAACSNDTSSLELICMDQISHAALERLGLSCSERSFKLLFDRKKSIFDGKLTNIW